MSNSAIRSSSGTRHLALFVPELLSGLRFLNNIPTQDVPNLPALQLLLSRVTTQQDGFDNYYLATCEFAGISVSKKYDVPLAGIAIASEKKLTSDINSDFYMFAEPVVMQADRDSVVLVASLQSDISLTPSQVTTNLSNDESIQLITEINQHFADEPWTLHLSEAGAWYLNSKVNYSLLTTTISNVLFKNTQDFLPQGDDVRYWRKIINEIEMLLFASEVNAKRIANNKATVSSLWLWGGGKIPEVTPKNTNLDLILGDNHFLQSISQLLSIPYKPLSKTSLNNSSIFESYKNIIVVNTQLSLCWQQRDIYSWITVLKQLESELFVPIVSRLRKGFIDSLSLYQNKNETFVINRRHSNRWWKPVKPLTTLSSKL